MLLCGDGGWYVLALANIMSAGITQGEILFTDFQGVSPWVRTGKRQLHDLSGDFIQQNIKNARNAPLVAFRDFRFARIMIFAQILFGVPDRATIPRSSWPANGLSIQRSL